MNSKTDIEALRYPIGKYRQPGKTSANLIRTWIDDIVVDGQAFEQSSIRPFPTVHVGWTF